MAVLHCTINNQLFLANQGYSRLAIEKTSSGCVYYHNAQRIVTAMGSYGSTDSKVDPCALFIRKPGIKDFEWNLIANFYVVYTAVPPLRYANILSDENVDPKILAWWFDFLVVFSTKGTSNQWKTSKRKIKLKPPIMPPKSNLKI